jgi:hypothetical protein
MRLGGGGGEIGPGGGGGGRVQGFVAGTGEKETPWKSKVILKTDREEGRRAWTELIWHRTGTSVGLL